MFPWKEPPELKVRTINRARTFLSGIRRRSEVEITGSAVHSTSVMSR